MPPKPLRSPMQEPSQHVSPSTPPSTPPPPEPTESNSPQNLTEVEEAPQCRFHMDCPPPNLDSCFLLSFLKAADQVFQLFIRFHPVKIVSGLTAKPWCLCFYGSPELCPFMFSISPSVTWAAELLSDAGSKWGQGASYIYKRQSLSVDIFPGSKGSGLRSTAIFLSTFHVAFKQDVGVN